MLTQPKSKQPETSLLQKATQGDAKAQYELGRGYLEGVTIIKDLTQAFQWLSKAAAQNHADAQRLLGKCYENGWGVTKDYTKAFLYYKKAAEQGNIKAQCDLGLCYEYGNGVKKSYSEALKWYKKAAEQKLPEAYYRIGKYYVNEQRMFQEYISAARWYRKAADLNHASAQVDLGYLYLNGTGVVKNNYEAIDWFKKAAEQGNAAGQNNLGWCYLKGLGTQADYTEAFKWFDKAASQGYARAIENLNEYFPQWRLIAQGDTTDASQSNTHDAQFYNNRGCSHFSSQQYEKALNDFSQAILLAPKHPQGYSNRAKVYYTLKAYDKAIEDFNKSFNLIDEEDPDDLFMLGESYFKLNQFVDAYAAFNSAQKIYQTNFSQQAESLIKCVTILYLSKQNALTVLEILDEGLLQPAIRNYKFIYRFYHYRALINTRYSKYALALADIDAAIQAAGKENANADMDELLTTRVHTLYQSKDYTKAEAELKALITHYPNSITYYCIQGIMQYEQQQAIQYAICSFSNAIATQSKRGLHEPLKEILLTSAYANRAYLYYLQGDIKAALDDIKQGIACARAESNRISSLLLFNLGLFEYQSGQYQAALESFQLAKKAYDVQQPEPGFLWLQANLLEWQQMPNYIQSAEENLHKQASEQAILIAHKASELAGQKLYQQALLEYNRALMLAPQKINYLVERSEVYFRLGQYQQAQTDITQVIIRDKSNSRCFYLQAQIYEALQQEQEALEAYQKALALNNHLTEAFYPVGCLLAKAKQWQAATAYLLQAVDHAPTHIVYRSKLVDVLLEQERYQDALPHVEYLLQRDPKQASYHFTKGLIHLAQDSIVLAYNAFSQCLAKQTQHTAARFNRAYCYYKLEQYTLALQDLSETIQTLEQQQRAVPAMIWFCQGIVHQVLQQPDKAMIDFRKAQAKSQQKLQREWWVIPELQTAFTLLEDFLAKAETQAKKQGKANALIKVQEGETLLQHSSLALAMQKCEEALNLDSQCPEAYWLQGKIYGQQKQWQNALNAYTLVNTLNPQFPDILTVLADTQKQLELQLKEQAHEAWLKETAPQKIVQGVFEGLLRGLPANKGLGLEAELQGLKVAGGDLKVSAKQHVQKTLLPLLANSQLLQKSFKEEYLPIITYKLVERLLGLFAKPKSGFFGLRSKSEDEQDLIDFKKGMQAMLEKSILEALTKARPLIEKQSKQTVLSTAPAAFFSPSKPTVTLPTAPQTTVVPPSPAIAPAQDLESIKTVFGLRIEPGFGVVALMCNKKEVNPGQYEHAFLIAMQLEDTGKLVLNSYHFVQHPHDKQAGLVNMAKEEIQISANDSDIVILQKQDAILKQKKFAEFSAAECHFQAYNITLEQAQQLHAQVALDAGRSRKKEMPYFLLGNKSAFNISISKDAGHNCFTWAREKLQGIDIPIKQHWTDYFIARTSSYLADNKQCVLQ